MGGTRYLLVFVNCATRYNCVFALKFLSSADIHEGFDTFVHRPAGLPNFSAENGSNIIAAAAGHQLSNGLVESH